MYKRTHTLKYLLIILLFASPLSALAISSSNYQILEDYFSSGGNVTSSSASYIARDAIGNIGVGSENANGTNYRNQSGPITTNFPSLSFSVTTPTVDLGYLGPSATATGTANFRVLNYTSSGYSVIINGPTPTNGTHALTALTSQTASSAGTEQFGINLVANTSPISFGANPVQQPSSSFGYGQVASGYNSANFYKYVSGDTIAYADKSSGRTDYTISYIANIANSTPGGQYSSIENLVVVGTY